MALYPKSSFFRSVLLSFLFILVGQVGWTGHESYGSSQPPQLKLMTYNLRNFSYLYRVPKKELGKIDTKVYPIKPEYEVKQEGAIIRREMPDILALQEVLDWPGRPGSGRNFLEIFNHEELNDAYRIFFEAGNDPRGINVAILVKKNLPFQDYRYYSNRDLKWNDKSNNNATIPMFSRDLPVLEIRMSSKDERPALIAISSHYKSQRDRSNDSNSRVYRYAQFEATREILKNIKRSYGEQTNIILMADFNEELTGHAEAPIEEVTEDCFDLTNVTVPLNERITEVSFAPGGIPHYSMLDDIKLSGEITKRVLTSIILRYQNNKGEIIPLPTNWNELRQFPSDHFPVETIVDASGIIQNY